uniref:General transcription and DNA repair factor IIH subunit TFB4 n=1 Tax=Oryza meridionalis TaxID=40149 RepID=A0A0E0CET5_9ORYZ
MASSKLYSDDVSLAVVVVDTNPLFWATAALPFADFFAHLIHFVNSLLLLNHLNHVVVITAGLSSCTYIFDSSDASASGAADVAATFAKASRKMDEFIAEDARATTSNGSVADGNAASLLSGALGFFGLVLDIRNLGYVAVMNSIFSAQRSMVPIDSCIVGTQDSAFLQQASYITGGVYLKPQELNGLFQYLAAVFATDLHSRTFLRLPKTLGVDFRASCFCHKKTIDMGYVCSVCLSIFCKYHKNCSTCGSEFNRVMPDLNSVPDQRQ